MEFKSMDLKKMLDVAGVDVTQGKAKQLIDEGYGDVNYGRDRFDRYDRFKADEDEDRRDKIAYKLSHGKSPRYTSAVMDFLNDHDDQENATVQEFEAWANKNRPDVLRESVTRMLEVAGVDITQGKAKLLIEKYGTGPDLIFQNKREATAFCKSKSIDPSKLEKDGDMGRYKLAKTNLNEGMEDDMVKHLIKNFPDLKSENDILGKINAALKTNTEYKGYSMTRVRNLMNNNDFVGDIVTGYRRAQKGQVNEELDISADASPQEMQSMMKKLQKELADHKKIKNAELVDQIEQDIHELGAMMKKANTVQMKRNR